MPCSLYNLTGMPDPAAATFYQDPLGLPGISYIKRYGRAGGLRTKSHSRPPVATVMGGWPQVSCDKMPSFETSGCSIPRHSAAFPPVVQIGQAW
jgi:hypothetical protein